MYVQSLRNHHHLNFQFLITCFILLQLLVAIHPPFQHPSYIRTFARASCVQHNRWTNWCWWLVFFSRAVEVDCRPLRSRMIKLSARRFVIYLNPQMHDEVLLLELTCSYQSVLGIKHNKTKWLYRSTWDLVYVYTSTNIAVAPPSKVGVMNKAKLQGFLNLVVSSCQNMCPTWRTKLSPTNVTNANIFYKNKTMAFLQEIPYRISPPKKLWNRGTSIWATKASSTFEVSWSKWRDELGPRWSMVKGNYRFLLSILYLHIYLYSPPLEGLLLMLWRSIFEIYRSLSPYLQNDINGNSSSPRWSNLLPAKVGQTHRSWWRGPTGRRWQWCLWTAAGWRSHRDIVEVWEWWWVWLNCDLTSWQSGEQIFLFLYFSGWNALMWLDGHIESHLVATHLCWS